jgi:hypothetical protein
VLAAAIVLAVIVFFTGNLPQSTAVAALKGELMRPNPVGHGPAAEAPSGGNLASLPSRAEVPSVVAKILEEARASGVELPRGQYEYVAERDGFPRGGWGYAVGNIRRKQGLFFA